MMIEVTIFCDHCGYEMQRQIARNAVTLHIHGYHDTCPGCNWGKWRVEAKPIQRERVQCMLETGLTTEGAQHKQWVLREVASMLGIDLNGIQAEEGVAP